MLHKRVATENQYAELEQAWEEQLELREELKDKPSELKHYEEKLKQATKTVTRKVSIPKTKVIKQPVQQASKPAANDAARTAIKPIAPQKPLPNQQIS